MFDSLKDTESKEFIHYKAPLIITIIDPNELKTLIDVNNNNLIKK